MTAYVHFDYGDTIEEKPVNITKSSVIVRWKEGTADVDPQVLSYIGYYLYYQEGRNTTWIPAGNTSLNPTTDWQYGVILGLKQDTNYSIDISVYRIDTTGMVHEDRQTTSRKVQEIKFRTLKGI